MQSVCVFCGSSPGVDPTFAAAAQRLGRLLASSGRTLIYGGGHVGLMGIIADAALESGGRVVGVIPRFMGDKELAHGGLTEIRVVESMHERKALMAQLADGFIALPGGLGTLEELFEVWTWGQLGLHAKPYGLLNVSHFFTPLLTFLDQLVEQRFVTPEHREMLLVSDEENELLQRMAKRAPKRFPKWIDQSET